MKRVMRGILLELMFNTTHKYIKFIMNYHFYSKERNLKKLVTNLNDKTEYVIHIRKLKQALNQGLNLKKF